MLAGLRAVKAALASVAVLPLVMNALIHAEAVLSVSKRTSTNKGGQGPNTSTEVALTEVRAAIRALGEDWTMGLEQTLAELRRDGWRVAVHNDYRLDGRDYTFWLLTHPSGLYVKGEGPTDAAALAIVAEEARSVFTPSP